MSADNLASGHCGESEYVGTGAARNGVCPRSSSVCEGINWDLKLTDDIISQREHCITYNERLFPASCVNAAKYF